MFYGDFSNWSLPLSRACLPGVRASGPPSPRTTGSMAPALAHTSPGRPPDPSFSIRGLLYKWDLFFKCPSVSVLFFSFFCWCPSVLIPLVFLLIYYKRENNKQVSVNRTLWNLQQCQTTHYALCFPKDISYAASLSIRGHWANRIQSLVQRRHQSILRWADRPLGAGGHRGHRRSQRSQWSGSLLCPCVHSDIIFMWLCNKVKGWMYSTAWHVWTSHSRHNILKERIGRHDVWIMCFILYERLKCNISTPSERIWHTNIYT